MVCERLLLREPACVCALLSFDVFVRHHPPFSPLFTDYYEEAPLCH